jgi:hypothetical protein
LTLDDCEKCHTKILKRLRKIAHNEWMLVAADTITCIHLYVLQFQHLLSTAK